MPNEAQRKVQTQTTWKDIEKRFRVIFLTRKLRQRKGRAPPATHHVIPSRITWQPNTHHVIVSCQGQGGPGWGEVPHDDDTDSTRPSRLRRTRPKQRSCFFLFCCFFCSETKLLLLVPPINSEIQLYSEFSFDVLELFLTHVLPECSKRSRITSLEGVGGWRKPLLWTNQRNYENIRQVSQLFGLWFYSFI